MKALLGTVPTALLLLVPVFAVLLKILYVRSGKKYLEHLVFALHSHAFFCLAMLVLCGLHALDRTITPHWGPFGAIVTAPELILALWLPVYFFIAQKRVYGEGWTLTGVRYVVLGNVYGAMLTFAALVVAFASVLRM